MKTPFLIFHFETYDFKQKHTFIFTPDINSHGFGNTHFTHTPDFVKHTFLCVPVSAKHTVQNRKTRFSAHPVLFTPVFAHNRFRVHTFSGFTSSQFTRCLYTRFQTCKLHGLKITKSGVSPDVKTGVWVKTCVS